MIGVFLSSLAISFSIALGLLFYFVPDKNTTSLVKSAETVSFTQTPIPSQEIVQISIASNSLPSPYITSNQISKKGPLLEYQNTIPTILISPQITSLLTITPTIIKIPSTSPTIAVIPTSTLSLPNINIATTASEIASGSSSLSADIIFSLINTYRTSHNLSPFVKDETTCAIAQSRAPQVHDEIFVTGNMHSGLLAHHFPYWITENIISIDSEQNAVDWWLNDASHKEIIESGYKYSCIACLGNSCSEIFTNYVPK